MVDSDAGSPQLRSLSRASSKNRNKGKRGSGGDSFDPNVAGYSTRPALSLGLFGRLERQLAEMKRLGMDEMNERVDGIFILLPP